MSRIRASTVAWEPSYNRQSAIQSRSEPPFVLKAADEATGDEVRVHRQIQQVARFLEEVEACRPIGYPIALGC